jgi:hypothetical protein
MQISFCFLLIIFSLNTFSKEKIIGRQYFTPFLGHLHKNADNDSESLTIVQCSHSVKLLDKKNVMLGWSYVMVGEDKGYMRKDFLSEKRPNCFQQKYQKFYNSSELDITEMYFWGRLSDHYLSGQSRAK